MSETTLTPFEIAKYYADLLIIQYHGKPKAAAQVNAAASALIQPQVSEFTISAAQTPTAGEYYLVQNGITFGPFGPYTDNTDVQAAFQAIPGFENVEVSGTLQSSDHSYTIKFVGVTPILPPIEIADSTMLDFNLDPVKMTAVQSDKVLPLAVQDGFNLIGDDLAVGAQLDILGKYVGITRTGPGFTGQITLNDSDFLSLIRLAISRNSLGSSLADIDDFINFYFPGNILVFDLLNMRMSYMLSTSVGSFDLIQRVIVGNLLPKPMGVGLGVIIYAPVVSDFFGFRTYEAESPSSTPFNSYEDYQTDWLWLDYTYGLFF